MDNNKNYISFFLVRKMNFLISINNFNDACLLIYDLSYISRLMGHLSNTKKIPNFRYFKAPIILEHDKNYEVEEYTIEVNNHGILEKYEIDNMDDLVERLLQIDFDLPYIPESAPFDPNYIKITGNIGTRVSNGMVFIIDVNLPRLKYQEDWIENMNRVIKKINDYPTTRVFVMQEYSTVQSIENILMSVPQNEYRLTYILLTKEQPQSTKKMISDIYNEYGFYGNIDPEIIDLHNMHGDPDLIHIYINAVRIMKRNKQKRKITNSD